MNDGSESEPRYAWVMAAIGTTPVAMNFGAFGSIVVFLKPVSLEFAWPRGATSLAYTVGALAIASGGIMWGRLADRRGTRPVVLVGTFAQPAALFLLSGLGSLPEFYLLYVLLGGVGFAAVNVPIIANVGLWFTRNKGLALGIVSAGSALGQGVGPFVAAQLISASGWCAAYLTLAVAYLLIAPPLALMVRTPPPLAGPARGGAALGAGRAFPQLVPARLAATSLAVVVFFGWAGMGLGGWHGGHVFDLTGGYTRAYADATLAGIVNLIIVAALIRRVRRAAPGPQVEASPSLAGTP